MSLSATKKFNTESDILVTLTIQCPKRHIYYNIRRFSANARSPHPSAHKKGSHVKRIKQDMHMVLTQMKRRRNILAVISRREG